MNRSTVAWVKTGLHPGYGARIMQRPQGRLPSNVDTWHGHAYDEASLAAFWGNEHDDGTSLDRIGHAAGAAGLLLDERAGGARARQVRH